MSVWDTVSDAVGALTNVTGTFAETHGDGIAASCIVAGLIVAFCGRVILRPVVFLTGFVPTAALFSSVGIALAKDGDPNNVSAFEAAALALAFILACCAGLLMLKVLFRVAVFAICGACGAILVFELNLFIVSAEMSRYAEVIRDMLAITAAILVGIASVYRRETSILIGTAFDGTAVAVYALAGFMKNRPNIVGSTILVENTPKAHAYKIFYASLAIGLSTFAALMQFRLAFAEGRVDNFLEALKRPNGYAAVPDVEQGINSEAEPPKSPPSYSNEENGFGDYGTMEHEYSVVSNLGAPPLGGTEPADQKPTTPMLRPM